MGYFDGRPSRSMAYKGFHPDGDPLERLLKDESSPASILQSQSIMEYTMMAARADPWSKRFSP